MVGDAVRRVSRYSGRGTHSVKCSACKRRIRDNHPYVGLEDYDTGKERAYHAKPACQEALSETISRAAGTGKLLLVHHYHTCGDEASGYECYAGCFSSAEVSLN